MNQQEKAQREINRGKQAAEVLKNPLFVEAITFIKADLFATLMKTNPEDIDKREDGWRMLRAFELSQEYLEKVMRTGDMGAGTIEILNQQRRAANIN